MTDLVLSVVFLVAGLPIGIAVGRAIKGELR